RPSGIKRSSRNNLRKRRSASLTAGCVMFNASAARVTLRLRRSSRRMGSRLRFMLRRFVTWIFYRKAIGLHIDFGFAPTPAPVQCPGAPRARGLHGALERAESIFITQAAKVRIGAG